MPTLSEAAPTWVGSSDELRSAGGKGCKLTNQPGGATAAAAAAATYAYFSCTVQQHQKQQWWELHFHEYRCHTGVTGVTEGQLVMMGMNLVSLIFGPETFTTSFGDVAPSLFLKTAPQYLLSLPIQAFLAFPFYLLLIGMLFADVVNGSRLAAKPAKAVSQLLGCLVHVLMHIPLYSSSKHMGIIQQQQEQQQQQS
ncbi:aminoalcoholphosphotransferase, putative [Eimeria maxima]|uniref:Aminoalcoholphosphotransferase, putative n=1 Tax=Eimeria maxima TaxID=5804 RepID=U6M440_EIMMA|nr:aminoalcoholphosphotransferase, putative [Eimeria maxima]CDJ58992.1 aminoalcoholphosphotransferase, putative [Eimeria maxima]